MHRVDRDPQEPGRRGLWKTNLTDREMVTRRRSHPTPSHALAEVTRLMRQGHAPAFRLAYLALERAVPPAPLPDLPVLDQAAD